MGIFLESALIMARYNTSQEGIMCVANNSLIVLQSRDFFDFNLFKAP